MDIRGNARWTSVIQRTTDAACGQSEGKMRAGEGVNREGNRINWVVAWAWSCAMVLLAASLVVACARGVAVV